MSPCRWYWLLCFLSVSVCHCCHLCLSACMLWDARKLKTTTRITRAVEPESRLGFLHVILPHRDVCVSTKHTENYHGSNTVFLVGMLMSVVGGVFVVFALMALCYRSVVVHKNFSLCLRLVCRYHTRRTKNTFFSLYVYLVLLIYISLLPMISLILAPFSFQAICLFIVVYTYKCTRSLPSNGAAKERRWTVLCSFGSNVSLFGFNLKIQHFDGFFG